ncbi:MAG: hypothetical protein WDW36_005885 [Sanguina aurantia]
MQGLLDDAKYAELYARSKWNQQRKSPSMLRSELSAKRISKADVSRALESVFGSITPGGQLKPGTDRLDDEDEGEEDSPDQGRPEMSSQEELQTACRKMASNWSLGNVSLPAQSLPPRAAVLATAAKIEALLFDCDGVLVDTERDGHRPSFNKAFAKKGLVHEWDEELYGRLLETGGGKERMAKFFQEVADQEPYKSLQDPAGRAALGAELHKLKTDIFMELVESGAMPLRPGVQRLIREAMQAGIPIAVCSTSNERAVSKIVEVLLGPEVAAVMRVFAGDMVPRKKPDPSIYLLAAQELGVSPAGCVVIEDSRIGMLAAKAAGMTCVITKSSYTGAEKFDLADAIFDCIGDDPQRRFSLDPVVQRLASPVAAWARSFACRWDAGSPQKVTVEYDPADLESFITLADALEEAFPRIVIEGNEGVSGAFEVSTEGTAVFSKLASGGLTPDIQTLIDSITKHIAVPEPTALVLRTLVTFLAAEDQKRMSLQPSHSQPSRTDIIVLSHSFTAVPLLPTVLQEAASRRMHVSFIALSPLSDILPGDAAWSEGEAEAADQTAMAQQAELASFAQSLAGSENASLQQVSHGQQHAAMSGDITGAALELTDRLLLQLGHHQVLCLAAESASAQALSSPASHSVGSWCSGGGDTPDAHILALKLERVCKV